MKYYTGIITGKPYKAVIFRSNKAPDTDCHPINHAYCYGGYKTKHEAIQVAMYQNHEIIAPTSHLGRLRPAPIWDGIHNSDFPMNVYR